MTMDGWTLVVFNETDEKDWNDCACEVLLYHCEGEEDVTDRLANVMYADDYTQTGLYYWYLFKGRDLNAKSDWSPEETGGLDLHFVVEKATRTSEKRHEEEMQRKKEEAERKKRAQEERKKQAAIAKAQILEAEEKAQLDQLLRKHGLPDWVKGV